MTVNRTPSAVTRKRQGPRGALPLIRPRRFPRGFPWPDGPSGPIFPSKYPRFLRMMEPSNPHHHSTRRSVRTICLDCGNDFPTVDEDGNLCPFCSPETQPAASRATSPASDPTPQASEPQGRGAAPSPAAEGPARRQHSTPTERLLGELRELGFHVSGNG